MAHLSPTFWRIALDGFFDEGGAVPFGFGFADFEQEIAKDFRAAIGVIHFGMKFDGVNLALHVFDGARPRWPSCHATKALRPRSHMIAVAVPNVGAVGVVFK